MSLPPEIRSALAAGQGLMVPDPARAAAIRLAFADEQIAAGRSVWSTPDIVTPSAFIDLQARETRRPLMSRAMEWALLRQFALRERADRVDSANSLADAWQRSLQRLRDLDISTLRVAAFGTPEADSLVAASQALQSRAAELGIVAPALCRPRDLALEPQPRLALGFPSLPRAYADSTTRAASNLASVAPAGSTAVYSAAAPEEEIGAALAWASQLLEQNANAKVLVVVPQGQAYDRALQRALLDGFRLDAGRESAILFDRQRQLHDAAAVREQLFLLRLLALSLPIADCCLGLRNGGRTFAEQLGRAELAHFLATKLTGEVEFTHIEKSLSTEQGQALPAARQWLSQMSIARKALSDDADHRISLAERLATASNLLPVEWRDRSPDQGFALQQAWQELLVECAQLADLTAERSLPGLLSLLGARAARTAWPQSRGASRLHIVRQNQDPILIYDGIWVCGLTASQWPQAAVPDAWIPKPLQIEAGYLAANASGRMQEARLLLTAWQRSSRELHLSYPALLDEQAVSVSPLLAKMGVAIRPVTATATPRQSRASQIIAAAPRLQQFADECYSRQVQGDIKRGPQVLNLYNECAFRGAANLRLLVPEAEEAAPGLEPLQSGTLLHEALRRIWGQLRGSEGLALIPDRETNTFVASLVADLVREQMRKAENSSSPRRTALAVEERRLVDRITALLAHERQRAGFVVEHLEEPLSMTVGGVSFRMRVDRIDRVHGEFLLIDYKSGRSGLPSWRESPPREIQLLIYREALLAQNIRPQGLVSWHLLAKEVDAGGAVSGAVALPKALLPGKALTDWEVVGRQWSELIQQIASRLWQGDAELRPLKNACDFCDLVSLCRRDERLGVEALEGDDRSGRDNAG